ncbi:hypothetical protein SPF06_06985 [Sinomonas sp. JGH33]|uniref:Bacterial Pleckstrin homology domain-containing protein n=1 Tax=Sinomonas terricola TaxID=3110330 RepID=A0ABU5T5P0_9MICC|nr:hypothetical protein [Sinomonas sp. JGH33]MEA5454461.1 hypothetical protein [Sinomonas sp. JGH33]
MFKKLLGIPEFDGAAEVVRALDGNQPISLGVFDQHIEVVRSPKIGALTTAGSGKTYIPTKAITSVTVIQRFPYKYLVISTAGSITEFRLTNPKDADRALKAISLRIGT